MRHGVTRKVTTKRSKHIGSLFGNILKVKTRLLIVGLKPFRS